MKQIKNICWWSVFQDLIPTEMTLQVVEDTGTVCFSLAVCLHIFYE